MDRDEGEELPLFVWGRLLSEKELRAERKLLGLNPTFPDKPGVFALSYPYEGMVCEVDQRCPAQFVNDSRGVRGAQANVKVVQVTEAELLNLLDPTKGFQMLLQFQAIRHIPAAEQLFLNYGELFWDSKIEAPILAVPVAPVIEEYISDDEEPENKEESKSESKAVSEEKRQEAKHDSDTSSDVEVLSGSSTKSSKPPSAQQRKKPVNDSTVSQPSQKPKSLRKKKQANDNEVLGYTGEHDDTQILSGATEEGTDDNLVQSTLR